jgi:hypothetical protein
MNDINKLIDYIEENFLLCINWSNDSK